MNFPREPDIGFEKLSHQFERLSVFLFRVGSDTIGRNEEFVVAHVSIVRGEENTEIPGDSGDYETACTQITQQCLQRGREETGMLRFQNEVIALFWLQLHRHLAP